MIDIIAKLKCVCDNRRVYLYGAGRYGRILYAFMREQNIGHFENFIVSRSDAQRSVLGEGVITLDEYAARSVSNQKSYRGESGEEELIIVAVSEKYSAEIVRLLEERGLHNFWTVTQEEWEAIEHATLFDSIAPQKNIAVLMYHRIIDSDYGFWKLNVSPGTFEKHIKYISENYKVLRLEENWNDIVKPERKYVVITFDDGYVDNYQFALPLLEKYQVPATMFVSTDLIDTNEMFWWDELEKIFIIDKYMGEFVFGNDLYKIADSSDRKNACHAIRNRIKNMNAMERRDSMGELRSALRLKRTETFKLRSVNTAELERMAESPFVTIGGHTKSHISMGDMHSEELLRSEIEESLNILEHKTGKKVNVFAYPFGGAEDRCDTADQILSECGIQKTVLVKNGNVNVNDDMRSIPRHMVFEAEDIEKKLRRIWGLYG